MADYFTSRGLPVPPELTRNPLTNWRRLLPIAIVLLVGAGVLAATRDRLAGARSAVSRSWREWT